MVGLYIERCERKGQSTRKKKHLAFFYMDIFEGIVFNDPEEHVTFDLVEPFLLIG